MTLSYTHTRICVTNFSACFRFYHDTLGFAPKCGGPDDVYTEFDTGKTIIALFKRELMAQAIGTRGAPAPLPNQQDKVVFTFAVADVDGAHKELAGRGVKFLAPPKDEPDWFIRVAHFRDPDGNLLEINSPLKTKTGP